MNTKKRSSVLAFAVVILGLLALCAPRVWAQEQTPKSTTTVVTTTTTTGLEQATNPSPVLFDTATACLAEAAKILSPKRAASFCLEARKLEAHRAEQAAKSAAKASQPKNPCGSWFMAPSYCYGYGNYGGGYYGGYGYGGGGYVTPYRQPRYSGMRPLPPHGGGQVSPHRPPR